MDGCIGTGASTGMIVRVAHLQPGNIFQFISVPKTKRAQSSLTLVRSHVVRSSNVVVAPPVAVFLNAPGLSYLSFPGWRNPSACAAFPSSPVAVPTSLD